MSDKSYLDKILHIGNEKARNVAETTIKQVKKNVGLSSE